MKTWKHVFLLIPERHDIKPYTAVSYRQQLITEFTNSLFIGIAGLIQIGVFEGQDINTCFPEFVVQHWNTFVDV